MKTLHNILERLFLETFCFTGIVAVVVLGAFLYKPPVEPPEQRNYSHATVAPSGDWEPPYILEDE